MTGDVALVRWPRNRPVVFETPEGANEALSISPSADPSKSAAVISTCNMTSNPGRFGAFGDCACLQALLKSERTGPPRETSTTW